MAKSNFFARGILSVVMLTMFLSVPVTVRAMPVRLMLQWTHQAQFAGYYVALEKGFYREQGLDVSIASGGPGLEPAEYLVQGKVDFASLWLSAALSRSDKERALVNVAQIVNSSNLVLVSRQGDIVGPSQLSGKKISIWGGDFQIPYLAWFQAENVKPEIFPQYYSVNLFLLKGVDACAAMYYNEVHMLYQTGMDTGDLRLFFLRDYGFGFPEDGIYATQTMLEEHPQTVRSFRSASLAGWRYASEHPEEALEIVMSYVEKDNVPTNRPHMKWMLEKILASVMPGGKDQWTFGNLSRQDYEKTVEAMRQRGQIHQAPEYESFTGGTLRYVP